MSTDTNQKPALTISFRLKDDGERAVLLGKAKQSNSNVTDFLRGYIFGNDKAEQNNKDTIIEGLVEDITFMFKFFNKNAKNLDITGQEKGQFTAILKKITEMTQHESE